MVLRGLLPWSCSSWRVTVTDGVGLHRRKCESENYSPLTPLSWPLPESEKRGGETRTKAREQTNNKRTNEQANASRRTRTARDELSASRPRRKKRETRPFTVAFWRLRSYGRIRPIWKTGATPTAGTSEAQRKTGTKQQQQRQPGDQQRCYTLFSKQRQRSRGEVSRAFVSAQPDEKTQKERRADAFPERPPSAFLYPTTESWVRCLCRERA